MSPDAASRGCGRRDEGRPVGRIDEEDAGDDDEQDDEDLDRDEHQVDPQRLLDAERHESAEHQDEQDRHEIDGAAVSDGLGDRRAQLRHERPEVRAPPLGHHAGAEEHLQDQIPPDDPREELAERGVRERVGRAGHRHSRCEFRVAQGGQSARDRSHDEADHDRGSCDLVRRASRECEDAGADDDADPEHREVERGQGLLEAELRFIRVGDGLLDRLRAQNGHLHTSREMGRSLNASGRAVPASTPAVGWERERQPPQTSADSSRSQSSTHASVRPNARGRTRRRRRGCRSCWRVARSCSRELSARQGARDDLRIELSRIESDVAVVDARSRSRRPAPRRLDELEGGAGSRERACVARAPQERPRGCRARGHGAARAGRRRRRRAGGAHRRDE